MSEAATLVAETRPQEVERFDVLVAGAGISGIGGAYHLTKQCPDKSFIVLEEQEAGCAPALMYLAMTWRTHRRRRASRAHARGGALAGAKRPSRRKPMSWRVVAPLPPARSARTSPITEQNL